MKLDRYVVIGVGLSIVWALIISVLFYGFATRRERGRGVVRKPVVVAMQPLGIGATVGPETVKIVQVEQSAVPKGAFSRTEDVVGRAVINPVLADEPILEGRLSVRGSGPGLAPLIPAGMRAVSVRVNDVVGVAGFVLPGMHVDVLVTGKPPGRDGAVTTTALQNISVLSAGQVIQADPKDQSINAQVVTLLVTPPQAEILTLANNDGKIQLVLRNSADSQTAATPGRQATDLYGIAASPPPPVQSAAPPRPAPRPVVRRAPPQPPAAAPRQMPAPEESIVIIRGTQTTVEQLRRKTD